MIPRLLVVVIVSSCIGLVCSGQERQALGVEDASLPRLIRDERVTKLLVDGRPQLLLAGELHNSSASSLPYMRPIWDKLAALNLNTVVAPLAWEQTEPVEGQFDFSLLDGLIDSARAHRMRLVLLWFGTYKNSVSSYVPDWVKRDSKRFVRMQHRAGTDTPNISPICQAGSDADARALAAAMRHLRQIDGHQHTVVMVQVENEVGIRPVARDHGPFAQAAFDAEVPGQLLSYLQEHRPMLIPELSQIWKSAGEKTKGTWPDVFGSGADEVFSAWFVGRYVGAVAAAGKREYPLPMYANAWLIGENNKPGDYPSGGPVSKMLDVWRAAAPDIDFVAPDIYLPDFKGICASYTRSGNPLWIPEAQRDAGAVGRAFYAIAQCGAIGFSPFGIESIDANHPLRAGYSVIQQLTPMIAERQGTDRLVGFMEDREEKLELPIGAYTAHVNFKLHGKKTSDGYGLILASGDEEFYSAGWGFGVNFSARQGSPLRVNLLSVEEGHFESGGWKPGRRLNGDETGGGYIAMLPPNFSDQFEDNASPQILKIRVYRHD